MCVKKFIFIALLFLFCSWVFAQDKRVDSLLKTIKGESDSIEVKTYNKIAKLYLSKGLVDSGFTYAKKAYTISSNINFTRGNAIASVALGRAYNYMGMFDSSLFFFRRSKQLYENLKDTANIAGALNNIGVVYKEHGNIPVALDYYFKAMQMKEKLKDTASIAISYYNIAQMFSEANDSINTLKYFLKALKLRTIVKDEEGIGMTCIGLGTYYRKAGQLENAIVYFNKGLAIGKKLGDQEAIAIGYYNLASIYYTQNKINESVPLFNSSLEISRKTNNYEGIATCLGALGEIKYLDKDYKNSVKLLEEAYSAAQAANRPELVIGISDKLSTAYETYGDFKNAIIFRKIWISKKDSLYDQETIRKLTSETLKYEYEKEKIILQKEQEKKEAVAKSEALKKDLIAGASILFLIVVSIFTFITLKRLKENRHQKNIIETQRNEMIGSINYAKRIQFALLAHSDLLNKYLPHHFVLFQPKDIVSGDFYWAALKDDYFYLAVCDSTGHGVPGAFMSLLNTNYLNEAIIEKNITAPNEVLNHVRKRLLESMDGGSDGMDAILIKIPINNSVHQIQYAAANNSPVLIRDNQIIELPKDKMPVGKGELLHDFKLQSFELQKGDTLYLYTDGYADQFGGPKGKKLKYKQLNQILLLNADKSIQIQKEILESTITKWKGELEQVDDICIIGIKL